MFTGEELPIRKYRGDLVDRRGKVKARSFSAHGAKRTSERRPRGQSETIAERAREKPADKRESDKNEHRRLEARNKTTASKAKSNLGRRKSKAQQ